MQLPRALSPAIFCLLLSLVQHVAGLAMPSQPDPDACPPNCLELLPSGYAPEELNSWFQSECGYEILVPINYLFFYLNRCPSTNSDLDMSLRQSSLNSSMTCSSVPKSWGKDRRSPCVCVRTREKPIEDSFHSKYLALKQPSMSTPTSDSAFLPIN